MQKRFAVGLMLAAMLLSVTAWAAEDDRAKELDRVQAATKVLNEIMGAPDKGVPQDILASAKCVAVVPSMMNGGFIVGARYGKGVATCRSAHGWSAPAPIRIEGGSYGLQIGGQAIDLVMLVMNQQGMDNLLSSKFKIGADASAAAGPVGRQAEGSTDWKMRAQVLTYSRARGAFAGISLNGAVIKQDDDDTKLLYGRVVPFRNILMGNVQPPEGTHSFLATVSHWTTVSRENKEEKHEASASTGASGGTAGTAVQNRETGNPGSTNTSAVAGNPSARPGAQGMAADSAHVQEQILHALRNQPGASRVTVNVTNERVELVGSVPDQSTKDNLKNIAQKYAGDRTVSDSQLSVK